MVLGEITWKTLGEPSSGICLLKCCRFILSNFICLRATLHLGPCKSLNLSSNSITFVFVFRKDFSELCSIPFLLQLSVKNAAKSFFEMEIKKKKKRRDKKGKYYLIGCSTFCYPEKFPISHWQKDFECLVLISLPSRCVSQTTNTPFVCRELY